jgi:BirA family biotin operon repressor/biotin-[acetyl-CoA-carboxylase] ligase
MTRTAISPRLAITSFEKGAMAAVCSWPVRWDVHYVDRTASTNTDLVELARAGAAAGTVVRAGHQTAGRGRLRRTWLAPPGSSLLASILLPAEPVPFVVAARVALAARDACYDLAGVDAALKWPNDLLVGERKLAGLLAEADSGSPTVVVGIGCNVAWPAGPRGEDVAAAAASDSGHEDQPFASLASAGGTLVPPAVLLDGLLGALDGWLARAADEVLVAYRSRCTTLGHAVRVTLADRTIEGVATGITRTGELEVAAGALAEVVRAGDVVHVRGRHPGRRCLP